MGPEIVEWIHLAQDTYQWRAAVNMANFWITEMAMDLLTSLLTSGLSRSNIFYKAIY
jgi:hypothetical protein